MFVTGWCLCTGGVCDWMAFVTRVVLLTVICNWDDICDWLVFVAGWCLYLSGVFGWIMFMTGMVIAIGWCLRLT